MDGALLICVEREGGARIAYTRSLLCGRAPTGFFSSVRRLSSKRDEQRVRDIVSSHRDGLPERPLMSQLTREAIARRIRASRLRGPRITGAWMERVDALGVRPAVAAAGAPERASLEQVFGRPDLKVGRQNERKGSQQVARLREWGLLGARWCPPRTMASMTAMLARVEEWSGALPEGSKERKPPREVPC